MAVIGLQPIMLKDAMFTVAADDYSASVIEATFLPQPEVGWMNLLCSARRPFVSSVQWSLQLGFVQDFVTEGALTEYLTENAGGSKVVTLSPISGGRTVSATVLIVPASMGGVPNQQLTAVVSLPLFGAPDLGELGSS